MTHGELIKALGGGTKVADWFASKGKPAIDREAVYKWQNNGVPWRWRVHIAKMAKEQGVKVPKDFVPGVPA